MSTFGRGAVAASLMGLLNLGCEVLKHGDDAKGADGKVLVKITDTGASDSGAGASEPEAGSGVTEDAGALSPPKDCEVDAQCDDASPCTTDWCIAGTCVHSAANDGATCDDGDLCTTLDVCAAGVCSGQAPITCVATDACHVAGTCESSTGICTDPPVDDGTGCSDGNLCTQKDTCQKGTCVGAEPVVCVAMNDCHGVGTCAPQSGTCTAPLIPNGSGCSDGNPCTSKDVCTDGTCAGSAEPEGSPCAADDGNACTVDPTCVGGACGVLAPVDCDDGNACTTDGCFPSTGCVHAPIACSAPDACHAAACFATVGCLVVALDCGDENACTTDTCDPATGCHSSDGSCDDEDACTTDTCDEELGCAHAALACDDQNACTTDGCDATLGCTHVAHDGACDDANACTLMDVCVAGSCTGGLVRPCMDGNVCTDDACDPLLGCLNPPNTASCEDGDLCTVGELCQDGACAGGGPRDCNDQNVCTDDACEPKLGCVHDYNTAPCDDGDACAVLDVCTNGTCRGQEPRDCSDGNACTADGCAPSSGCVHVSAAGPCDDGDACTHDDGCTASGDCGGVPVSCDDQNPCTDDGCAPGSGCTHVLNVAPCDDGSACTTTDVCAIGQCVGGGVVACPAEDACNAAGLCDPKSGACIVTPKDDGVSCEDGNGCTVSDRCEGGLCVAGAPVVCHASDDCHVPGMCNPTTGVCTNPQQPLGTPCQDGDACTSDDRCKDGLCVGGMHAVCADAACGLGVCDPTTGDCGLTPRPDGVLCDDDNACSLADWCEQGGCIGHVEKPCPAMDACHVSGTCEPLTGLCDTPAASDGTACEDGNACTLVDTCLGGACAGTDPKVCADGDDCTDPGPCEPFTGKCFAIARPDGTVCDDGDLCTTLDTCHAGGCSGAALKQCADGPCQTSVCDPLVGVCSAVAVKSGETCDDGDACTASTVCADGHCAGGAAVSCDDQSACTTDACDAHAGCVHGQVSCDDQNPCTADSCDPATGCVTTPLVAACDDGDACTVDDTCQAGQCAGAPKACPSDDACLVGGLCDPATGDCKFALAADGTSCSDGNACTQVDQCQHGTCIGTTPLDCGVAQACHTTPLCDPTTGQCVSGVLADGTPCDDADGCTWGDRCVAGTCEDGALVSGVASCLEILKAKPKGLPNGLYTVNTPSGPATVYCDMAGGGWTLAGYGASATLPGPLTATAGLFDVARTGAAVIDARALVKQSAQVAYAWAYAGAPSGGLVSYGRVVQASLPAPECTGLDPKVGPKYGFFPWCTDCPDGADTSEYAEVALTSVGPEVALPETMYTRRTSLTACFGTAYGLVQNESRSNAQADWSIDAQPYTAVYLRIGTAPNLGCTGVVEDPGGGACDDGLCTAPVLPSTMAIWFR